MSVTRDFDCIIKGLGDYSPTCPPLTHYLAPTKKLVITLEGEEGEGASGGE